MNKYYFHVRHTLTKELMEFAVIHNEASEARRIATDWSKASNYNSCTLYLVTPFNPVGNICDIHHNVGAENFLPATR